MIFINQIRMKIGVMFGNPETTTGGIALQFCAYKDERIGQGRENAKNFLREKPKTATEIEKRIKEHLSLKKRKKAEATQRRALKERVFQGCVLFSLKILLIADYVQ